jgi:hypothetical protein
MKCNLLGSFLSYGENEVLWIRPLGPYSQNLKLKNDTNKLECYTTLRYKDLPF